MHSVASLQAVCLAPALVRCSATRNTGSVVPRKHDGLQLKGSRVAFTTPSSVRVSRRREVSSAAGRLTVFAVAEDPDTARGAITQGSALYKAGKYEEALAEFERALTLPGTGQKRFTDKPAESSDEEKHSALYNIACCHCQLKDERLAMVAFAGALEKGFKQFSVFMTDPEMEFLRANPKLPGLLKMYNKQVAIEVYKLQNPEAELPQERKGWESFAKGDWLFSALTKRKPLSESEWMDMIGDGTGSGMMAKTQNRRTGSEENK